MSGRFLRRPQLAFSLCSNAPPPPPPLLHSPPLRAADNLTDFQLAKELKFLSEHRGKLAGLEAALNPFAAARVADAASDPVQLTLQAPDRVDLVDLAAATRPSTR